jgi:ABC-type sugar transport system substrate-binding protein
MKVRRVFATVGAAAVLSLGMASAAHAADYPPTTVGHQVVDAGSTVAPTMVDGPTNAVAAANGGLPFTGGNDGTLVWVGLAAVGTGSFAAWRFRRRPRVS